MIDETLTLWENGAITLPKAWRKRHDTRHFLARENEQGYLVIMPIVTVEFYQKDGAAGLHFPMGIEAGELLQLWDKAGKKIGAGKKKRSVHRKKNGPH